DQILAAVAALARLPDRGAHPRELLALGIRAYRDTFFKPYRILYGVEGKRVDVYLIADGRRDFQTLLARRLLGASQIGVRPQPGKIENRGLIPTCGFSLAGRALGGISIELCSYNGGSK